jgi:hypothetical protein
MTEWLTNNPTGTNQQAFVKRMMGTIQNERNMAEQQIKKTRMQRVAQFEDVRSKDPEGYENVLRSWEIDPQEYDDWKKSGYKKLPITTTPTAQAPATDFDALWAKHGGK